MRWIFRALALPLYLFSVCIIMPCALIALALGRGKEKLYVRLMVFKPSNRMDAIGILDRIADAVQMGTGVNDRWYAIDRLDWTIDKKIQGLNWRYGNE